MTLANPSLHRGHRGRGRTAFERNLLPGFARCLLDQVAQREPDFLVPVETKGARVLEAVVRYARDELLEPVGVPTLYASALAYLDPDQLAESRVLIVDDAVRTGVSLNRQRQRVERYGPTVVGSLACVGDLDASHPRADCYRSVEAELYREYVWQLAELVVARGLPPEVDHHLFEIRLPGRLRPSWWALEALLSDYGVLTVDGPESEREELLPITLHFPRLPGSPQLAGAGPHKLRFFPDPLSECIYAVAVSFPPLQIERPEGVSPDVEPWEWSLPREEIAAKISAIAGADAGIGQLLINHAHVVDPETAFAALSTTMEVGLIRGLAQLLGNTFPGASIRPQREAFDRLYGPAQAEQIAAAIAAAVLVPPIAAGGEGLDPLAALEPIEPPYLDKDVSFATGALADRLREMYKAWSDSPEFDPAVRIGLSMEEIVAAMPEHDRLLASRSVDFGLAMTTLVPFVDIDLGEDEIEVRRRYRVSEPGRDEERPYEDMTDVRIALSSEATAAICHCVAERSGRYAGQALERGLLTSLVGILQPLVCEGHSIVLRGMPGETAEQIVLCNDDGPCLLDADHNPRTLETGGGMIGPSPYFRERWPQNKLRLDARNSTEEIEEHVLLLVGFLDEFEPDQHRSFLRAWAMSTDRRLGLTHVRRSLDAALDQLEQPLERILSGSHHIALEPDPAELIAAANEKLDLLAGDWAAPIRERWKEAPSKRQSRALASLGAPESPDVYDLPRELTKLIETLVPLVRRLDSASAELWRGREVEYLGSLPGSVFEACDRVRNTLSSLAEGFDPRQPPADPREALAAAAEDLLDVIQLLGAFVAAFASAYRGMGDGHLRPPLERNRVSSVLSLDLAGSSRHATANRGETHNNWSDDGLNLAAQWARAFLGREGKAREGDDIWLEFKPGDTPILCAAAVQWHSAALRSAGIGELSWKWHAAVDYGQLDAGDGGNVHATALNRATKLAKECDRGAETDDVFVTPEALRVCSTPLRDGDLAHDLPPVRPEGEDLHPFGVKPAPLIALFIERLGSLADAVAELAPAPAEAEQTVPTAALEDEAEAAETGS